MKLHYYNDPGHGWVKVKRDLLDRLGIAEKVSPYSYEYGDHAYLEEDCDTTLLLNTLDERGIKWELIRHYSNKQSRIRGYNSYNSVRAN